LFIEEGLHLFQRPNKSLLVIICSDEGATIKLREFVTAQFALDALEDDVLAGHNRAEIEASLQRDKSWSTSEDRAPDENLKLDEYHLAKQ
jgi:hypothetical protein